MAARNRFSIAVLMAVVFFVAVDFAIVRAFWTSPEPLGLVVSLTTLPMINLLLLVLPKLSRRGGDRSFWLGFEAVGWLMVIGVVLLGWFQADPFFAPIDWVNQHDPFEHGSVPETAFLITFVVLFYTTPQVLAAMFGGRLLARYRVVIDRRSL
jgi:ABC-type proline/glycine betaine transport system permease subunit